MTSGERWEHGSEFAWPELTVEAEPAPYPWSGRAAVLFGSGRDALRGLVAHGMASRGWRRLWLPSFLCQEVVASICETGIEVAVYRDEPTVHPIALPEAVQPGRDVLFVVNTFGVRSRPAEAAPGDVIEDHTHDPISRWAFESTAAYCVASLRKTFPVPDGGVVWSPASQSLPERPARTEERERAAAQKTAAMLLKRYYLDGHPVSKDVYRLLSAQGEEHIATGAAAAASMTTEAMLPLFPLARWARARRDNRRVLSEALAGTPWLSVLSPDDDEATGFSVVVVMDSRERRERVRRALIEQRIYPAVLWPLEDPVLPLATESVELSRRILSLHCDYRYVAEDMRRVAEAVLRAG